MSKHVWTITQLLPPFDVSSNSEDNPPEKLKQGEVKLNISFRVGEGHCEKCGIDYHEAAADCPIEGD